jgi:hypothetical protein
MRPGTISKELSRIDFGAAITVLAIGVFGLVITIVNGITNGSQVYQSFGLGLSAATGATMLLLTYMSTRGKQPLDISISVWSWGVILPLLIGVLSVYVKTIQSFPADVAPGEVLAAIAIGINILVIGAWEVVNFRRSLANGWLSQTKGPPRS